jgi:hypothetical protein
MCHTLSMKKPQAWLPLQSPSFDRDR